MKNSQKKERLHTIEKPKKPSDLEELKKAVLSNEMRDSEVVKLGMNRKQFFVRLPTRMSDRLSLSGNDKIKFTWFNKDGTTTVEFEVVKHD